MLLAKIEDEKLKCERENRVCNTDFLDLYSAGIVSDYLKYSGARYIFDGGFENAERRVLVFLPDWISEEEYLDGRRADEDYPLEILRVSYREGGRELSHRDYLGSLLGLGLSRALIGDIIVYPGGADIIIQKRIEEFILANYFKAGRSELKLSLCKDLTMLNLSGIKTETIKDTLQSLRLDAFIASAYKCSRSSALEPIKQGLVFVNNIAVLKPDFELKEGDAVVLRGKGKCILETVGGKSRKDRIFIEIKRYI